MVIKNVLVDVVAVDPVVVDVQLELDIKVEPVFDVLKVVDVFVVKGVTDDIEERIAAVEVSLAMLDAIVAVVVAALVPSVVLLVSVLIMVELEVKVVLSFAMVVDITSVAAVDVVAEDIVDV